MFRHWLQWSAPFLLLWLLTFFTLSGAIVHWVACHSRLHARLADSRLVAPYFGSVAVLFALFLGFMFENVVAQKNRAFQAVQTEGTALSLLATYGGGEGDGGVALRAAIRDYGRAAIDDEWPQMSRERSSGRAEAALLALARTVAVQGAQAGAAVHAEMFSLVDTVAKARGERIAVVTTHAQRLGWTAAFLLGILTQVAIGMVHLDRARANAIALSIYTLSAVIALWLVAVEENPFRGKHGFGVSPAPIERALGLLDSEAGGQRR